MLRVTSALRIRVFVLRYLCFEVRSSNGLVLIEWHLFIELREVVVILRITPEDEVVIGRWTERYISQSVESREIFFGQRKHLEMTARN
jgi:hypothetical protein